MNCELDYLGRFYFIPKYFRSYLELPFLLRFRGKLLSNFSNFVPQAGLVRGEITAEIRPYFASPHRLGQFGVKLRLKFGRISPPPTG